jgi:3-mercaptopyruvate sulfurtransferase SseA
MARLIPTLIQPDELMTLLNSENAGDGRPAIHHPVVIVGACNVLPVAPRLLDAAIAGRDDAAGAAVGATIPGTVFISVNDIETGPDIEASQGGLATPEMMRYGDGNLLPAKELLALVEAAGVTRSSHVVVYTAAVDDTPLLAARLLWALHWLAPTLELQSLALLDGGLAGWCAATAGTPGVLSRHCTSRKAARTSDETALLSRGTTSCGPASLDVDDSNLATTKQVIAAVRARAVSAAGPLLVDTRCAYEFEGESLDRVDYSYIGVAGRMI